LQLDTIQKEVTTFGLENRYEQVAAVRKLSPKQADRLRGDSFKSANVGVFLGGMWLVPPVGASLTAGAAALDKEKTKKREQAQSEAIQRLKEGESAVTVPMDFRWSTIKTQFKREKVGEEIESAGLGSEERTVVAASLPLKIENLQYPSQQTKAHTDDTGSVSFPLARTLAEAAALKPGEWKVSAKWQGKWQEVGTVDVSQDWIDRAVHIFREQKLQATGKPDHPPAAAVSLKVSNGRLQAGMESDISLTVLNTGLGDFYRLMAVSESDVPALDGLEFDFGKLAPGEGLTLVRRIRIPRKLPPGRVAVRFRWTELNDHAPVSIDAQIPLKAP
jgi:hypothetical protein